MSDVFDQTVEAEERKEKGVKGLRNKQRGSCSGREVSAAGFGAQEGKKGDVDELNHEEGEERGEDESRHGGEEEGEVGVSHIVCVGSIGEVDLREEDETGGDKKGDPDTFARTLAPKKFLN